MGGWIAKPPSLPSPVACRSQPTVLGKRAELILHPDLDTGAAGGEENWGKMEQGRMSCFGSTNPGPLGRDRPLEKVHTGSGASKPLGTWPQWGRFHWQSLFQEGVS